MGRRFLNSRRAQLSRDSAHSGTRTKTGLRQTQPGALPRHVTECTRTRGECYVRHKTEKKTAGFLREAHTTWTVCPTWLSSLKNHHVLLMVERRNRELTAAGEVRPVTFKLHHHTDTHAQTSRWGTLHRGGNSPVATAQ